MPYGRRGGDEDGLDIRSHGAVHARHLHFVVEVGGIAQAAHDDAGTGLARRVDGETREGDDIDGRAGLGGDRLHLGLQHGDALGGVEHRLLGIVHADADDQRVDEPASARDDVGVPERHGIERAWIKADAFHGAVELHGAR